jgi:hypothetical protein
MEGALRSLNHGHLGTARLLRLTGQLHLMVTSKWPARQQEIAVTSRFDMNIELIDSVWQAKTFGEAFRLIVKFAAAHVAIDFLKTDKVGRFGINHFDHTFKPVTAIATADPFMNVVAENSQALCSVLYRARFEMRSSLNPAISASCVLDDIFASTAETGSQTKSQS